MIHDHNFYVPLVIIYCVFCRKEYFPEESGDIGIWGQVILYSIVSVWLSLGSVQSLRLLATKARGPKGTYTA